MGSRLLERRSRSRSSRPCVELCEGRTLLSAVLWTGGAGTDDWDTAANWSTDSLPGSGDNVTIPAGATVVHSDSDSDSIDSLTSSGTLSITGGTLAIASASTASTLTINGGTLTANGSLSVGGTLSLLKGTLSGSGTVNATGGMTLDTPAATQFVLDGVTLDNAVGETATWTTSATSFLFTYGVLMQDGAIFNNYGTMTVSGADIFAGTGALPTFNNDGCARRLGIFDFAVSDCSRIRQQRRDCRRPGGNASVHRSKRTWAGASGQPGPDEHRRHVHGRVGCHARVRRHQLVGRSDHDQWGGHRLGLRLLPHLPGRSCEASRAQPSR